MALFFFRRAGRSRAVAAYREDDQSEEQAKRMELIPQTDGVTGTPPAPSAEAPTPYAGRVPQTTDGVNMGYPQLSNGQPQGPAQQFLALAGQRYNLLQWEQAPQAQLAQGMTQQQLGQYSPWFEALAHPMDPSLETDGTQSAQLVLPPGEQIGSQGLQDIARDTEMGYTDGDVADYGITEEGMASLLDYKSSWSYKINAALRDGVPLDAATVKKVEALDQALQKLPVYRGEVYRRIGFDTIGGQEALEAFLAEHQPGAEVRYPSYTSASAEVDGYPVTGELTVTIIIQSENGRDLEGFGSNAEHEVLFARRSRFLIERVEMDSDGKPVIYMREVVEDGVG